MSTNLTRDYIQSLRNSKPLGEQVAAYEIMEGRPAELCDPPGDLAPPIGRILQGIGISKLYTHQLEAVAAIRLGRHVVVATPTASGKSLIYNLPLFDAVARDESTRALYIFPLKALTQDQLKTLVQWSAVDGDLAPTAAVYDGDTSAYRRKKIRDNPPHVVLTNPEMVHLAMLAYHAKWRTFFENLKLVVVDEVHTYRGLMGSHMAQVFRRLLRICRHYGARPTFVFASATIANPARLARQLTGLDVSAIKKSGAPKGVRHMVLMDPQDGPARAAIQLLKAAMARKLRTIVYTQSRKMAELITLWLQQQAGALAEKISVYRAGLTPEARRGIEADLKSGRLLAVVSTSALELGIDIGDLDICILSGYPGSMIATHQRSGRVGRKGQEAALILLAGQDAMDQYYIAHPDTFFSARAETAVINPMNPVVLEAHLVCAAAEMPLRLDEAWLREPGMSEAVAHWVQEGALLQSVDGGTLHTPRKRPHMNVDLRSAGSRYRIMAGDRLVGEINGFRLYRETHPGAVYLHQGQTFLVERIDEGGRTVHVQKRRLDYHTRVRTDSDVSVVEIYDKKIYKNTSIYIGKVKVEDLVVGYQCVQNASGRKLDFVPLEVPPAIFTTDSIWFELAPEITQQVMDKGFDLLGALHAAEHAAIGVMPLLVLADRNDLGGLATPFHPQTGGSTVFIYDGIPGGAGLCRQAFEYPMDLLTMAAEAIERCACEEGCPACIHSSKCGSGNQPMDKHGARRLLRQMALGPGPAQHQETSAPQPKMPESTVGRHSKSRLRYGVFDLETQRSAREVGGWHMAREMRVSCGVVYDAKDDTYAVYMEDQVPQLIAHLQQLDLVVGFNSKRFDYMVLSRYDPMDFRRLPSLDLLEAVHQVLGFRLSLDHLAEQTLSTRKTGSGLDALEWWRQGRIDEIVAYCRKDVAITRDLFLFARDNGYLIYRQKDGERFRIPMAGMVPATE